MSTPSLRMCSSSDVNNNNASHQILLRVHTSPNPGSPLKLNTPRSSSPSNFLHHRIRAIQAGSGVSSAVQTPKAQTTPDNGLGNVRQGPVESRSVVNPQVLINALNRVSIAGSPSSRVPAPVNSNDYLNSRLPSILNRLCGDINNTNFNREYQLDNYGAQDGLLHVASKLAKIKTIWDIYENEPGFKEKFLSQFVIILEMFEIVFTSILSEVSKNEKKQRIGGTQSRVEDLEVDVEDSPIRNNSVNSYAWLYELKLALNTMRDSSTESFRTRVPTNDDILAVRFLEDCIDEIAKLDCINL